MDKAVVIGNRRFTCLAPGLVRMEFSPTGQFEDRRSLVAYAEKKLRAFKSVRREKGATLLDTGIITIVTREDDKAFFPLNLETRWKHGGLLQLWRPGDKDYHNLGGTVRSLDVFNKYSLLAGVHTADMESPDAKAMEQIADNSFHVDPWFYRESGREDLAAKLIGKIHLRVRHRPDEVLVRTVNHATDQWRYGPGILSRSGYFFLNDSVSAVMDEEDFPVERNTPGTQDWYFFAYGDDYKLALRNWALLSGRSPLPAKHVFGIIMCRWPAFNEAEAKEYTQRFRKEGAPLSVMVIDMEWSKEGWCNWDWDHDHIGDPKKFFQWCRRNNMQVTLNVHPLHVREDDSHFEPYLAKAGTRDRIDKSAKNIPVDMCKKVEARAFMEVCHDEFLKHGVDFWWVDGCSGALNGTISQLVVNKVYFEHSDTAAKRGMLLSRYGGLGSHRYGVYFTGDTSCQWEVLRKQCEFNIRAGHVGVSYITHDIGGLYHLPAPLIEPNMYIRWLQFGVFNPVLRFHSFPGAGSRLPWDYGEENRTIGIRWLKFRNSLMPYIYTAARRHYETGTPIVRGLFFEHPRDAESRRFDIFFFGNDLVVAPVLADDEHREVYLPKGTWYDYTTGEKVKGGARFTVFPTLADVPMYAKAGSIIVRQDDSMVPAVSHVDDLILDVFHGAGGAAELYEDDGTSSEYKKAGFGRTAFTLKDTAKALTLTGEALKGKAFGPSRRITVNVVLDSAPKSALLNGAKLSARRVSYDADTRRCTVQLGRVSVKKAWRLTVRK